MYDRIHSERFTTTCCTSGRSPYTTGEADGGRPERGRICSLRYDDRTMMLIVFRSRLTAAAGSDYSAMSQAIKEHAQRFPGFVDIKSFAPTMVSG